MARTRRIRHPVLNRLGNHFHQIKSHSFLEIEITQLYRTKKCLSLRFWHCRHQILPRRSSKRLWCSKTWYKTSWGHLRHLSSRSVTMYSRSSSMFSQQKLISKGRRAFQKRKQAIIPPRASTSTKSTWKKETNSWHRLSRIRNHSSKTTLISRRWLWSRVWTSLMLCFSPNSKETSTRNSPNTMQVKNLWSSQKPEKWNRWQQPMSNLSGVTRFHTSARISTPESMKLRIWNNLPLSS